MQLSTLLRVFLQVDIYHSVASFMVRIGNERDRTKFRTDEMNLRASSFLRLVFLTAQILPKYLAISRY